jgi:hypothetical protein
MFAVGDFESGIDYELYLALAETPFWAFQTGQGQRRAEECVAVG